MNTVHLNLTAMVGLGVSENVQLELIKLAGLLVTTIASTLGAYLAYKNRSSVRKLDKKVERKRRTVRDPESESVVLLEDQRKTPRPHKGS